MDVLVIAGPIVPADIPALCRRACTLMGGADADVVVCDVAAVADPDAVIVDALARLQLSARRLGGEIRVLHAPRELQELITLMGLCDAVRLYEELRVEPRGQAEEREEPRGVEEETDPGDPTV